MNILNLLANDGFICVNKTVISKLGLNCAVLLGQLASMYNYNSQTNQLEDGWFYATVSKIQEVTGLSDYVQKQILDNLCEMNLIEQKNMGTPKRRYFKFNHANLIHFLMEDENEGVSEQSDGANPNSRIGSSEQSDVYNIYNKKYNNTENNNTGNTTINYKKSSIVLEKNTNKKNTNAKMHATTPEAPRLRQELTLPAPVTTEIATLPFGQDTKQLLTDYCLALVDSYSFTKTALLQRVRRVCREANNVEKGIQIICDYNITGNYKQLFKPSFYDKEMQNYKIVSEPETSDFVRDENGNAEEIW
jgi:hypothetical protein